MRRSLLSALCCVMFSACTGLLCLACRDTIVIPTGPTPTPTVSPSPTGHNTVSFRVLGNASSVRVRYSTPADGVAQVVTSLPYFNFFTTNTDTLFLSLEATPLLWVNVNSNPFLSIQIVVNDTVFREATSQDFTTPLSVSGTWRR